MHKKSFYLFKFYILLLFILTAIVCFLLYFKVPSKHSLQNKNHFVQLTLLPDLALCTSSSYIRHRSLTDLFSIYKDDGTLREYDVGSFIYAPSIIHNNYPSKVKNEK